MSGGWASWGMGISQNHRNRGTHQGQGLWRYPQRPCVSSQCKRPSQSSQDRRLKTSQLLDLPNTHTAHVHHLPAVSAAGSTHPHQHHPVSTENSITSHFNRWIVHAGNGTSKLQAATSLPVSFRPTLRRATRTYVLQAVQAALRDQRQGRHISSVATCFSALGANHVHAHLRRTRAQRLRRKSWKVMECVSGSHQRTRTALYQQTLDTFTDSQAVSCGKIPGQPSPARFEWSAKTGYTGNPKQPETIGCSNMAIESFTSEMAV